MENQYVYWTTDHDTLKFTFPALITAIVRSFLEAESHSEILGVVWMRLASGLQMARWFGDGGFQS